ncbi:MAG: hypothetical protein EOP14_05880 [Pseudomonas sp.]|nr:MAG: hypothetical protein EOP14_05880 [Pseudomonas sp.]
MIGAEETEQITLVVVNYERPRSGEYYDDNWLSCEVKVRAGAFRGKYTANFLTFELAGLLRDLERLYHELKGSAVFEPLESQLELKFSCDSLGHIQASGTAMDQVGIGHALHFSFSFDQTYLAKVLTELRDVVHAFPIRT